MKKYLIKSKNNVLKSLLLLVIGVFLIFSSSINAQKAKSTDNINLKTTLKLLSSENKPGEAQPSKGGKSEIAFAGFNLDKSSEQLEPKTVAFRLKVPKDARVSNTLTSVFSSEKGDATGPFRENNDTNYDYRWFIWNEKIQVGSIDEFAFDITPSINGITAHNKELPVEFSAYKYNDANKVTEGLIGGSISNNKFIAITDKFSWNDAKTTPNFTSHTTNVEDIPDIKLSMDSSSKFTTNDQGMSFAKSINYVIPVKIPVAADGTPYIKITEDNLFDSEGLSLTTDNYTVTKYHNNSEGKFITEFEFKATADNKNLPNAAGEYKEMDNINRNFLIKGAKVNIKQLVFVEQLAAGATRLLNIEIPSESMSSIKPAFAIKDINNDSVTIKNTETNIRVNFTNSRETGDETANYRPFSKKIVKVGSVDTTNLQQGYVSAFGDDTVTYALGEKIKNVQKRTIQQLFLTDEGYDVSQMYPTVVTTGKYKVLDNATMVVQGSTDNGVNYSVLKSFSNSDLQNGKSFDLPNNKYTNIRLVYKDLASGFEIDKAPTIKFKVVNRTAPIHHGEKVSNTAKMNYKYKIEDSDPNEHNSIIKNASTYFNYKNMQSSENGRYESNKTALNMRSNDLKYPPNKNDVFLFTVSFKNISNSMIDMSDYTIEDNFTENLSPYSDKYKTNGGSQLMNENYVNDQVDSNMILWNPDDHDTKFPSDVSVIQSQGNYKIKLPNGYKLAPDESLKLTYTMYVNDDFEDSQSLGNTFVIKNKLSKEIGEGQFWLSRSFPVTTSPNKKLVDNATKQASSTTIPVASEVVAYKIKLDNTTERNLDNITIDDDYDAITEAYSKNDLLNTEYEHYNLLKNSNLDMNLAIINKPSGFDESKVTVVINKDKNNFIINLGDNIIKPSESLDIIYTMKIKDTGQPGQTFTNKFKALSNNSIIDEGSRTWNLDKYQEKLGIIDVVKTAKGIENDGVIPNTNSLLHDDQIAYKIDIGNYHTRPDKAVEIKTFIDKLPSNIVLEEDTIKIEKATIGSDGKATTEVITPDKYSLTILKPEDPAITEVKVVLNDPYELVSGLVELDKGGTEAINRLYISYDATVDTFSERFPSIANEGQIIDRRNKASVFFLQDISEYVTKSGQALDDTVDDLDDDVNTKSYINSQATVKVYNDKLLNGNIRKTTANQINIYEDDPIRNYQIEILNTSLSPLYLSKIVDILPKYEVLDKSKTITMKIEDASGNTTNHKLNYKKDNSYLNSAGENQERLTFYNVDDESIDGITLPAAKKGPSTMNGSRVIINYQTTVDTKQVLKDFDRDENNISQQSNKVAMYLLDEEAKLNLISGSNAVVGADDSSANNGADDWDSDPTTKIKYYTDSPATTSAKTISPYVGMKANTVRDLSGGAEVYEPYDRELNAISPGDYIAWKVSYGNANNATLVIEEGTELVVILPNGINYEGLGRDTNGNEIIPNDLSNGGKPIVEKRNNKQILRWTTTSNISSNSGKSFYIRCSSTSLNYNQYNADAYLIPKKDELQKFYKKVIEASTQFNQKHLYDYNLVSEDISKDLPDYKGVSRFVRSSNTVDVYGLLHIASNYGVKQINNPSNNTSSIASNRVIDVGSRDEGVTFDMEVRSKSASKGLKNIVLINRLSEENDKFVINDEERGSKAKLRLIDEGNFKAKVSRTSNPNDLDPDFDDSKYKVEYSFKKATESFNEQDWSGDANSKWFSSEEMITNKLSFEDVTSFRLVFDSDYVVENNYRLNVNFDAKLADYNIGDTIAYNTFGVRGLINSNVPDPEQVILEPLKLGVKAQVPFDRATVTKVLNENVNSPKLKKYDFTLNTIDRNTKDIVSKKDYSVIVDKKQGNKWIGTTDIYNLDKQYDYSVVEKIPNHFERPQYKSTNELYPDGALEWNFTIENTPEKTLSVKYDANKGVDAPVDNREYYAKDTVYVMKKGKMKRDNYKFISWNTKRNGNGYTYKPGTKDNSFAIKKDTTLYAQWQRIDSDSDDEIYGKLPKGGNEGILLIAIVGLFALVGMRYYKKQL